MDSGGALDWALNLDSVHQQQNAYAPAQSTIFALFV